MDPLISVVLPVFNGDKYLTEAIESVLNQSYANFELLIIDDGSTDSSLDILKAYAQKDKRIKLISRENRGLVNTLNELIQIAEGQWIARMDADDICLPTRLEKQLERLESHNADLCGSWVKRFSLTDNRTVRLPQTDELIKIEMLFCSPFVHPSVMMRTHLAKALPYDPEYSKSEDYDLWVRAAIEGWKMTNFPDTLLKYRVHNQQVSISNSKLQQIQGQAIQKRYWQFTMSLHGIEPYIFEKGFRIFDSTVPKDIDMDAVEQLFLPILRSSSPEGKRIIFTHVTRLYSYAAVNCPDILQRWDKLNAQFGQGQGRRIKLRLLFFRVFRIQADSLLIKVLKILLQRGFVR